MHGESYDDDGCSLYASVACAGSAGHGRAGRIEWSAAHTSRRLRTAANSMYHVVATSGRQALTLERVRGRTRGQQTSGTRYSGYRGGTTLGNRSIRRPEHRVAGAG